MKDKYDLDLAKRFEESGNLYAYQVMISRMYEAIRKSYWTPDEEVKEQLLTEFLETVEKVGLSCNLNVCNNGKLEEFLNKEMEEIDGISEESIENYRDQLKEIREQLKAAGLPSSDQIAKNSDSSGEYLPKKSVKGYTIEEVNANNQAETVINYSLWKWIALLLIVIYSVYYFVGKRKKA